MTETQLRDEINALVYQNTQRVINGEKLNLVLNNMVSYVNDYIAPQTLTIQVGSGRLVISNGNFVDLAGYIQTFIPALTRTNTNSTLITLSGLNNSNIQVDIQLSATPDNALVVMGDGLYVQTPGVNRRFTSNLQVYLAPGKTFGKYTNGDIIPAINKFADEVIMDAIREAVDPTYDFPVGTLTANVVQGFYEIGTSLTIEFTAVFLQNDGGPQNAYVLKKTGNPSLSSDEIFIETLTITASAVAYHGTYSYDAGTVQYDNNLGDPTDNPIGADDVDTNTLTYTGVRKIFYGNSIAAPTDSTGVRALPQNRLANAGNVFNLTTGSTNTFFTICIPATMSIVNIIDLDALDAEMTAEYELQGLASINDAGGTPYSVKVYVMQNAIPYTTSHRHQITIA